MEDYNLTHLIEKDGSLNKDKEKKALYLSYATLYEDELEENLGLTSIELNNKYETASPVSWRRFLNHSSVKKFIDSFLNEKAEMESMKVIGKEGGKTVDALKVLKTLEDKKEKIDNSKFIIVHLPQKEYL